MGGDEDVEAPGNSPWRVLCHPQSSDHLTTPKLQIGILDVPYCLQRPISLGKFLDLLTMLKSTHKAPPPLPAGWTEHRAPTGWS